MWQHWTRALNVHVQRFLLALTHSFLPLYPPYLMLSLHYLMLIAVVAVPPLLPELLLGSGAWLGSMPDRASINEEITNIDNEDIITTVNGLSEIAHTQHGFDHHHDHYEAYGDPGRRWLRVIHDVGHWIPMLGDVGDAITEPNIQQLLNIQQLPERAVLPVFRSAKNRDNSDEAKTSPSASALLGPALVSWMKLRENKKMNAVQYRAVLPVFMCQSLSNVGQD